MRTRQLVLFSTLALGFLACGGYTTSANNNPPTDPGGTPAQAATIQVQDNVYVPSTVVVAVGGTVTWDWIGSGHSVTSSGSPSLPLTAPVSFPPKTLGPVVFATAGTYNFYCTVHGVAGVYGGGSMTGAIFVR